MFGVMLVAAVAVDWSFVYPVVFGGYLRCLVRLGPYWVNDGAGRFDVCGSV